MDIKSEIRTIGRTHALTLRGLTDGHLRALLAALEPPSQHSSNAEELLEAVVAAAAGVLEVSRD